MSRLAVAAGGLGMLAGFWTLAACLLWGAADDCPTGGCPVAGFSFLGALIVALGIGLVLSSIVSFFWRRQTLYASAVLSAAIAISVLLNQADLDVIVLWTTAILCLISMAASFIAARRETAMSEQANPMNLPVFG